ELQEPQPDVDPRPVAGLDDALRLLEPGLHGARYRPGLGEGAGGQRVRLGVAPGHEDAELPADTGGVLAVGRPVGIQDVPLVEDGVGDAAGGLDAHGWTLTRPRPGAAAPRSCRPTSAA